MLLDNSQYCIRIISSFSSISVLFILIILSSYIQILCKLGIASTSGFMGSGVSGGAV
jgi:hypothetical protein